MFRQSHKNGLESATEATQATTTTTGQDNANQATGDRQKAKETALTFGLGLGRFIQRNGLQLKDVGEWFGISEASVSKWRSGKATPYTEKLFTLIEKGMRLEEIFGDELASILFTEYQKRQAVENPSAQLDKAREFLSFLQDTLNNLEHKA